MQKRLSILCALLLACFGFTACETPGQTALLGAAIGGASGRFPLRNAAIGAGAGYLVGKLVQEHRRAEEDDYYDRRRDDYYDRRRDDYEEDRSAPRNRYHEAYAQPTDRRGFVISPYSGNVIDVRGIPHGGRVVDPSVNRIFVNP